MPTFSAAVYCKRLQNETKWRRRSLTFSTIHCTPITRSKDDALPIEQCAAILLLMSNFLFAPSDFIGAILLLRWWLHPSPRACAYTHYPLLLIGDIRGELLLYCCCCCTHTYAPPLAAAVFCEVSGK